MLEQKQFDRLVALLCLSSLCSLLSVSWSNVAAAGNQSQNTQQGLPLRRVGGGTRSGCELASSDKLVALIPERTIGKTTKSHPKFYFYIPENTEGKQIEFVLRDKHDNLVYETIFASDGKSGILSIELPASKISLLAANDDYHWYLSMLCNPANRSQDIVLEGFIQRVELDGTMQQKLQQATPLERVNLYQTANIWYDAIDTLAELKLNSPKTTTTTEWHNLLDSVGLADIAQKPLI
jgi:hypothetical protein